MTKAGDTLLKTYRQKRDFSKTAEPRGGTRAAHGEALYFCIQKHDATRLHYDFRIEWEGVLKSWAVTKGPSLDPAEKRLAVRVEDHPLEYGDFEGTIPKDEYGGGTVLLWDRGHWEPREDPDEGLSRGNLKMRLFGERMEGDWALVRMKPRGTEKRENWLLIKEKDETADRRRDLLKATTSVKTGREMEEIAAADETLGESALTTDAVHRAAAEAAAAGTEENKPKKKKASAATKRKKDEVAMPAFVEPQLATLVDTAPEGDDWLHEMKYDGYRVIICLADGEVRCMTRNGKDWTHRFAAIAKAAVKLPVSDAVLDGEVVAFDKNGKTDFSTLQLALGEGGKIACFLFDALRLDGEDLQGEPLDERKRRLASLLENVEDKTLLYSEHVRGHGPKVYSNICASGHEGIVSKRADAPYAGGRSKAWLKTKCTRRQEFVIGGWSVSDKKGREFSSVLLGVFDQGKLVYRGRVGSGFDAETMADLAARMSRLSRKTSPFDDLPRDVKRNARFVEPELVAEIDFTEMTADQAIRHGVFKGLRQDKDAKDVHDERPAEPKAAAPESGSGGTRKTQMSNTAAKRGNGRGGIGASGGSSKDGASKDNGGRPIEIAGVRLSHPDRIVFAGQGATKADLAHYYEAVAERMLQHAANRPLSLVRCPQGGQKHCFFQKHAGEGFPSAVGSVEVTEKDGSKADYLTVSDVAGLVGAVQMGTLEFHIWGSRNDKLDRPDRLVFDLDPDAGLSFSDVRSAAFQMKDQLADLGLQTYPLVTGGKGVHVVVPLERRKGWEETKGFAEGFARSLERAEPKRFTATMSKAKRKGKIFIDWLRNERGQTAIAPYSTRSREGAPVAVPVAWDELRDLKAANIFSIEDVRRRLAEDDPWTGYGNTGQSLTKAMLDAVSR